MNEKDKTILLIVFGLLTGISLQLNWASEYVLVLKESESIIPVLIIRLTMASLLFPLIFWLSRKLLVKLISKLSITENAQERYVKYDIYTYAVFTLFILGSFGLVFNVVATLCIIFLFFVLQIYLILYPDTTLLYPLYPYTQKTSPIPNTLKPLFLIFFISGFAALIYQVVWQRVLFTTFGVNIESVTIIVSVFMFGLGIGSLFGGYLSKKFDINKNTLSGKLLAIFSIAEISIGLFGIFSLQVIHSASLLIQGGSLLVLSITVFIILFIPTLMMGATLPLLVTYINNYYKNVGRSVGILYFVNTLGSALACFITGYLFLVLFNIQTVTYIAAFGNLIAGTAVYLLSKAVQYWIKEKKEEILSVSSVKAMNSSPASSLEKRNIYGEFF